MRDLALTLTLVVLIPLALRFPFAGVYLWAWLSLMNPHRLAYGFAQDLPFNMVVAIITLLGYVLAGNAVKFKFTTVTALILVFSLWISLTTAFAPVPDATTPLWERNIKTMLLVLVVSAVITNQIKIHGMVWVIAISLGYFGIKGGAFMALTGGNYIVFGPVNSMIEDNNGLALALILTLPLMNYLRLHTQHRLLRLCVIAGMILTLAAVIGSYSRGGFIAMAAMLGFLWLKSRAKAVTATLAIMAVLTTAYLMPQKYMDRLGTINELSEDTSFQGRLDAWEVALRTAMDRPFGAGFDGPRQEQIWMNYLPEAKPRASHSIYFMVLGEHGFVGLFLYLIVCFAAWRKLARTLKLVKGRPELLWAHDLAAAFQVSMVGFLVGGAALPMAYYDGFLLIVVLSACLHTFVKTSVADTEAAASDTVPIRPRTGTQPRPTLMPQPRGAH
jgi:probable O-glycosylation ligase (exosortase A-associated)